TQPEGSRMPRVGLGEIKTAEVGRSLRPGPMLEVNGWSGVGGQGGGSKSGGCPGLEQLLLGSKAG
ncbi:unnamed protein product, partial [Bubo scandiacus]